MDASPEPSGWKSCAAASTTNRRAIAFVKDAKGSKLELIEADVEAPTFLHAAFAVPDAEAAHESLLSSGFSSSGDLVRLEAAKANTAFEKSPKDWKCRSSRSTKRPSSEHNSLVYARAAKSMDLGIVPHLVGHTTTVRRYVVCVSFLFYDECPSHDLALERLREVMAEEVYKERSRFSKSRTKSRRAVCASWVLRQFGSMGKT